METFHKGRIIIGVNHRSFRWISLKRSDIFKNSAKWFMLGAVVTLGDGCSYLLGVAGTVLFNRRQRP